MGLEALLESDVPGSLWKDGGTTPATVETDQVNTWTPTAGALAPFTRDLDTAAPLLHFHNGFPVVLFDGTNRAMTTPLVRTTAAFTVHLLLQRQPGTNICGGWSSKADQGEPNTLIYSTQGSIIGGGATTTGNWAGGCPHIDDLFHVWSFSWVAGGPVWCYCDGAIVSNGSPPVPRVGIAAFPQEVHGIGLIKFFHGNCRIACFAAYDQAQDHATVREFVDWAHYRFRDLVDDNEGPTVYFTGNSMMSDDPVGDGNGVAHKCRVASSAYDRAYLLWKGGTTTPYVTGRIDEELGQLLIRYPGKPVVVHYSGGADRFYALMTPAQIYAALGDLVGTVKAIRSDATVILPTYIARAGFPYAERLEVVDLMLTNPDDYPYTVCDLSGNANLCAEGAELNPAYFPDAIHLSPAGATEFADQLGPLIDAAVV